jgi:cellulose synthase/poly-beta-1,6-N-acetylglucosamine synthase-like glycosyltransferase
VVVIDDGSTDGTVREVERLGLPNVRVVEVAAGGKSGALNVGVAIASHDLLVMVDGDTVVEPDAIHRLVQDFRDPRVGAIAGNVKVGNRDTVIGRWQHIEYVIGFNLDRRLYDSLGCIPTVAGALGAFRRAAVLEAGGLSDDTLAEDTDLTIALQRHGWRVTYVEDARAWTEAPATPRQLWRQRYRWSYGVVQSLWKHRGAMLQRGPAGRFGRRGLPLLALFGVALPMLGPLIDLMAIYGLFFFDWALVVAGWVGMLAVQTAVAIAAFRMDGERLRPLFSLPLQQVAYRQVMYLVLAQSVITAFTGGRLRWQKLRRTGRVHAPSQIATGSVSISTDPARRVGRG